jgi:hypothetical protein
MAGDHRPEGLRLPCDATAAHIADAIRQVQRGCRSRLVDELVAAMERGDLTAPWEVR